ncbi:MAG: SCO7613 C-terminal domain-containing membrane protein [Acidimicrobiales bacterium]
MSELGGKASGGPIMSADVGAAPVLCPRCRREVADAERCPSCGLLQTGDQAMRLRAVVGRLYALGREQQALLSEATALRREQAELLRALGAPAGPRRPAAESRPEVVRDVLLWLGSALVVIAALIFALFAWRRLGDTGRAALLFATTLVAAVATRATVRRLPATAEALGGVTLALFLVDWFVLRRGGVASGLSEEAWWALGTVVAAGLAVAVARWLRLQAVAAAVLVQVAALLVVNLATPDEEWTTVLGLALVTFPLATVAARLARERTWRPAAGVLAFGAALMLLGALALLNDLFVLGDGTTARLAVVLAAMALTPAGARATIDRSTGPLILDGLVAASVAFLLAAVTLLLAGAWSSPTAVLAAVAVLGTAAVGMARIAPAVVRTGFLYAGGAALVVGVLRLAEPVAHAVAAPLSWLSEPWGATLANDATAYLTPTYSGADLAFGAAVVSLLALAAAAALALAPARGKRLLPLRVAYLAAGAAVVGLVVTAPLAAGAPVWVATIVTGAGALAAMAGAVIFDRRGLRIPSLVLAGAAAVLGASATGWALATEAGTLGFLAVAGMAAIAATGASRTSEFRQALAGVVAAAAIGEGAAVAVSAGASEGPLGLTIGMVGGAVLVAGARWRPRHPEGVVLEAAGAGALALGAARAGAEEPWLAIVLTLAVVWLMVAGSRPARRVHLLAGAFVAVTAVWAWLAVLDVTVVEAYTLPAAVVAIGVGAIARRRMSELSSWPAFGPGLAIGVLPSLALALSTGGAARPLAVTAASLVVVLAGARSRLQAPLVLGGGALLVVGLDALWPVAAQVPRWVAIGTVGITLLWLGATAEHRLDQVRELGRRFRDLEPTAPLGP